MPYYQVPIKTVSETTFHPSFGRPILNREETVSFTSASSSSLKASGNMGNMKVIAAVAFVLFVVIIAVAISGPLGLFVNDQSSVNPILSPSPTASPTPTPLETERQCWIRVDNWYSDQIVRYVAVNVETGESYEANYAVAASNPAPKTGQFALFIPGYGAYKFTVYTARGFSVWWDSVYLNVDNANNLARLNIADSLRESTFENVRCSGAMGEENTIPMQ